MGKLRKIDLMYAHFGNGEGNCGECGHFQRYSWLTSSGKRGCFKCEVYGDTSSEASDWRCGYGACGLKNREYKGDKPIISLVKPQRREEIQIEGQMSLI